MEREIFVKILIKEIVSHVKGAAVRKCAMLAVALALPGICIFGGQGRTSPGIVIRPAREEVAEGGEEPVYGVEVENEVETGNEIQNETEVKTKDETEVQPESGREEKPETERLTEAAAVNEAIPDNDVIREAVYSYYGRKFNEKISDEEVEAVKGKLRPHDRIIRSGEDLLLMREWCDWSDVEYSDFHVFFGADLSEWSEEELRTLEILTGTVYVESKEDTFPARMLSYLKGATHLTFSKDSDMTDVSGTLPEGIAFPCQIKDVSLHAYREGKYKTLLKLLQDSQVETIWVDSDVDMDSRDAHEVAEKIQGFWLDDAAGIGTLKELLLLNGTAVRARDKEALEACRVERILGYADRKTDFALVGRLPALEELECDVMEECELRPLLDRKGFSLELHFFEDCPAFYQAVSWPEDESGERTPHSYQRIYDQDRMAECFTGWRDREKEYWTRWDIAVGNDNPCLRITDGDKAYELRPAEDESSRNHTNAAQFMYVGEGGLGFHDINFDGTKDLVLGAGRTGVTGPVRIGFAYLWNTKTKRYEFCPSYRWIDNPEVDEKLQLIRGDQNGAYPYHYWAIYRYEDGEFVMQSRLTRETLDEDVVSAKMPEDLAVPEVADVIRFREEIFENGEAAEVKNAYAVAVYGGKGVEIPVSCDAYYAEDSYWSDYDPDRREKVWPKERKENVSRSDRDEEEAKGKPENDFLTIDSGEAFAMMQDWYDWDSLDPDASVIVAFSEDLEEWPEGECFPQQIKRVWLNHYREGKYKSLLKLLQDSQVETITVSSDAGQEEMQGFWLDDVAGISTLKEVNLIGTAIRMRDEKALEDSGVERIEGCVDQKTDMGFMEGRSLYLSFYEDCPAIYQAVSWPEEVRGEETRHIYQRIYDQGRMAECFTELPEGGDEGAGAETERKNPVLRITDGAAVYEIKQGEGQGVEGNYAYENTDEIRFQDINFDGTKDLILDAGRLGPIGQWRYEAAYIRNPETARYEFCPSYRWIDSPTVDAEHRLVRSYRRDWGNDDEGSCSWAIYRYVDGEFVMQSMLTQENLAGDEIPDELSLPEEAALIRYQEKIFENGEAAEVKNAYAVRIEGEEEVIPACCNAYYAEDSYWGGY